MKREELKPCPFCGAEAERIFIGNDFTKTRKVEIECTGCHTKMVVGAIRNTHEWCDETVTKKWNNWQQPLPPAEGAVNFGDIYELLGRGIDKIMRGESSLGALADEAETFINSEVKKRLAQQHPPAEGAEEILKKHMNGTTVQEYKEELFIEYNTVLAAMQEFATLHAQRIADKMVDAKTSRNGC